MHFTPKTFLVLATLMVMSATAIAQDSNRPCAEPSMLYVPLVYDGYKSDNGPMTSPKTGELYSLDANDAWLQEAIENTERTHNMRQRAMIENPQLVAYNANRLPEAPPEGVIPSDPRQGMLTIVPPNVSVPDDVTPADAPNLKIHNWLHIFNASLQFTQAYISGNWYQGGENNLALLGSINWNCNLNQDIHPNWLFNNSLSLFLRDLKSRQNIAFLDLLIEINRDIRDRHFTRSLDLQLITGMQCTRCA